MADDETPEYGPDRLADVLSKGMLEGETPSVPADPGRLRERAAEAMDEEAFDYIAGGAGEEHTVSANREAFEEWRVLPRMVRDIEDRDLSVELFGEEFAAPLMLAPLGVQSIAHEEAELASARAAADADVPLCLSTQSSTPLEEVADALGETPRWFQLYWAGDRELNRSLVERAEAAGYSALVVTVDVPVLGWRVRDLDHGYFPFLEGHGVANYFSDPVFRDSIDVDPDEDPEAAVAAFQRTFSEGTFTWEEMEWLREVTDLPIVVKGVLAPGDASHAVAAGADAVVVSNHGGRQVDRAVPALEALPDVIDAVDVPVLFDSGVRTGTDAFVALALGAEAVMLGRPYAYGLGIDGEAGVRGVLANVLADLDLAVALSGHRSVEDLDRSALVRRS